MSPTLETEPAAENKYILKKTKTTFFTQPDCWRLLSSVGEGWMLKAPLIAAVPLSARRVYQPLSSSKSCRSIKQLAPAFSPDSQWGRFIGDGSQLAAKGRLHHRHHGLHCAPAVQPVRGNAAGCGICHISTILKFVCFVFSFQFSNVILYWPRDLS